MLHTTQKSDLAKMESPAMSLGFWNISKLCHVAFAKFPEATEIKDSIGSGLYVDIKYKNEQGQEFQGTIYDGLDDKYLTKNKQ